MTVGAGTQQYRLELSVQPQVLAQIRRVVGARLRYWGLQGLAAPVLMCVTELLSNVHKHADSARCVLVLEATSSCLRVVVSDSSAQLPIIREPDWSAESGRGIFLLSKTADAWGAEPTSDGKDVWIEFRAPSEGGT